MTVRDSYVALYSFTHVLGEQSKYRRLRRTEHRDYSGHSHVHRFGGEPDGVDADHRSRYRRKVAQTAELSVGQFTLTVPRGCWISTNIR